MAFKKVNWLKYGSNAEILEISLKDVDGRQIDFMRTNDKDSSPPKIARIIRDKYGFNLDPNYHDRDYSEEIEDEKKHLQEHLDKNKVLDKGFKW